MNILWFVFTGASLLAAATAFIWLAITIRATSGRSEKNSDLHIDTDLLEKVNIDVEHIFNDEFREELRNRGRLHFEKIINDNAMFLKQDLQLTASQLNEYMQDSLKKVLKEEFAKYEESIESAKQIAIESIAKTQEAVEQQRALLEEQLKSEVEQERSRAIDRFEENMSQIINHYLLEAIGNELDLSTQIDYIFRHMEDNKEAIVEDIKYGT